MGGRPDSLLTPKKSAVILAVIVVVVLIVNFVYAGFVSKGWHKEVLNDYELPGYGYYQMAWDSQEDLQLAYSYGGVLMYGQRTNGSWNLVQVAGFSGASLEGVSLAVDSQDGVHICAYSLSSLSKTERAHILYANNADGEWQLSLFNSSAYCTSSGIFVDENDIVHILFTEKESWLGGVNRYKLVAMEQTEVGWSNTSLIDITSTDVYLNIEDVDRRLDGAVGVLYTFGYIGYSTEIDHYTLLNYSVYSDGALGDPFSLSSLAELSGRKSLCHDLAGNAYVAGYREIDGNFSICFASNREGSWELTDVTDAGNTLGLGGAWGSGTSIAVGDDGNVHLGYFVSDSAEEKYEHTIRYSSSLEGNWSTKIVDECSGWSGDECIAIQPDDEGDINIVYFSRETHKDSGDTILTMYATNEWGSDDYLRTLTDSILKSILVGAVALAVLLVGLFLQERRAKLPSR